MLAFTVNNHRLSKTVVRLPRVPGDWALVRVRMAGICNTDVEILRGYHNFRGTPGHEFVFFCPARVGRLGPDDSERVHSVLLYILCRERWEPCRCV